MSSTPSPLRFRKPAVSKNGSVPLFAPKSTSKSAPVSLFASNSASTSASVSLVAPNRASKRASVSSFAPNSSEKSASLQFFTTMKDKLNSNYSQCPISTDAPASSSSQLFAPKGSSKSSSRSKSRYFSTPKSRSTIRTIRKSSSCDTSIVDRALRTQCETILREYQRQIFAVFRACHANDRANVAAGVSDKHTDFSESKRRCERMSVSRFFRALQSVHATRTWLNGNRRFVVRALRRGVDTGSQLCKKSKAAPKVQERVLTLTAFEDVLCLMASLCAVRRAGAYTGSNTTQSQAAADLQSLITHLDLEAIARAADKRRAQQNDKSISKRKKKAGARTPSRQLLGKKMHESDGTSSRSLPQRVTVKDENVATNQNKNKQSGSAAKTLTAIDEIIRRAGVWDMVVKSDVI